MYLVGKEASYVRRRPYGETGRYVTTVREVVSGTGRRDFFDDSFTVPSRLTVTAVTVTPPKYRHKPRYFQSCTGIGITYPGKDRLAGRFKTGEPFALYTSSAVRVRDVVGDQMTHVCFDKTAYKKQ